MKIHCSKTTKGFAATAMNVTVLMSKTRYQVSSMRDRTDSNLDLSVPTDLLYPRTCSPVY